MELFKAPFFILMGQFDKFEAVLWFLEEVLIPRANPTGVLLSKKGDVLFLLKLIWILCSDEMLNELSMNMDGKSMYNTLNADFNSALSIVYLAIKRRPWTTLFTLGYMVWAMH